MKQQQEVILIGYSGHGFVAADILRLRGYQLEKYCESVVKEKNPYGLLYLGKETDLSAEAFAAHAFFVGIGDNLIRSKVYRYIASQNGQFAQAIHPGSNIASTVTFGEMAMVAAGVCINPLSNIGNGVICNTASGIDHECVIGDFSHIGPGAVLCGNVTVGQYSFIGAAAVVRQGITIGNNCMIGAGAVVVKDVPDGSTIIGNPGRLISV